MRLIIKSLKGSSKPLYILLIASHSSGLRLIKYFILNKENVIKNALVAFIVGGLLGSLSELLLRGYMMWFDLPRKESGVMVILTLITIASVLTACGVFDVLVSKVKAALIIPITGFAHSMTSAALEYKHEGLVLGIGSNIFKLAGTVILYGVVAVYFFGLIRLLVMGG